MPSLRMSGALPRLRTRVYDALKRWGDVTVLLCDLHVAEPILRS